MHILCLNCFMNHVITFYYFIIIFWQKLFTYAYVEHLSLRHYFDKFRDIFGFTADPTCFTVDHSVYRHFWAGRLVPRPTICCHGRPSRSIVGLRSTVRSRLTVLFSRSTVFFVLLFMSLVSGAFSVPRSLLTFSDALFAQLALSLSFALFNLIPMKRKASGSSTAPALVNPPSDLAEMFSVPGPKPRYEKISTQIPDLAVLFNRTPTFLLFSLLVQFDLKSFLFISEDIYELVVRLFYDNLSYLVVSHGEEIILKSSNLNVPIEFPLSPL